MAVTAASVTRALKAMMPRGAAWPRDVGKVLHKFWAGVADELVRVFGRADDLLNEAHPLTVDELLADWENELGLPDPCITEAQTEDQRRAAIAAKLIQVGGQSPGYYIGVASRLGFTITITEPFIFYMGIGAMGDPIGSLRWLFVWTVNADAGLTAAEREMLQCALEAIKPAHTEIEYIYS